MLPNKKRYHQPSGTTPYRGPQQPLNRLGAARGNGNDQNAFDPFQETVAQTANYECSVQQQLNYDCNEIINNHFINCNGHYELVNNCLTNGCADILSFDDASKFHNSLNNLIAARSSVLDEMQRMIKYLPVGVTIPQLAWPVISPNNDQSFDNFHDGMADLERQLRESLELNNDVEGQLETSRETLQNTKGELDNLKEKLLPYQKTIKTIQDELGLDEPDGASVNEPPTLFQDAFAKYERELNQLTNDLETANGDLTQVRGKFETADRDLNHVRGEFDRVSGELTASKTEESRLSGEFDRVNVELSDSRSGASRLRRDVKRLNDDINELDEKLNVTKNAASTSADEVERLEHELRIARGDKEGNGFELKTMTERYEEIEVHNGKLESDNERLDDENKKLKGENEALKAEVERLERLSLQNSVHHSRAEPSRPLQSRQALRTPATVMLKEVYEALPPNILDIAKTYDDVSLKDMDFSHYPDLLPITDKWKKRRLYGTKGEVYMRTYWLMGNFHKMLVGRDPAKFPVPPFNFGTHKGGYMNFAVGMDVKGEYVDYLLSTMGPFMSEDFILIGACDEEHIWGRALLLFCTLQYDEAMQGAFNNKNTHLMFAPMNMKKDLQPLLSLKRTTGEDGKFNGYVAVSISYHCFHFVCLPNIGVTLNCSYYSI